LSIALNDLRLRSLFFVFEIALEILNGLKQRQVKLTAASAFHLLAGLKLYDIVLFTTLGTMDRHNQLKS